MKIIQIPTYACAECGEKMVGTYVPGRAPGEEAVVTVKHPPTMNDCKDQNKTAFAPVRVHDTDGHSLDGRAYRA